jgi:thioredoxin
MFVKMILIVGGGVLLGGILGYVGKCSTGACPLTANPFRGALYGGFLGLVMALMLNASSASSTEESPITVFTPNTNQMDKEKETMKVEMDKTEFQDQILDQQGVALVDFYADWCGPCRSLAPTIAALADTYAGRVTVAKVNVDHNPELAQKFGIQGIPAVLIFKDGQVQNRLVGLQSQSEYEKALDQVLAK